MEMRSVNKAPTQDDKVSWWYWFEKLDGNRAKCKNCEWLRDRGPAKSTSILRCHLKSKHSELYDERMQAQATTPNPEQRGRKRTMVVATEEQSCNDLTINADDNDLNDESDGPFLSNSFDKSPPKLAPSFVAAAAAVDHSNEPKIPNQNSLLDDMVANGALNQNLGLSNAMLSVFMNTLGGENGTNANRKNDDEFGKFSIKKKRSKNTANLGLANNNAAATSTSQNSLPIFVPTNAQPIVKICRVESFSAAHRLHNDNLPDYLNREIFGKCNNGNGHGHNYTWKVLLKGPVDAHTGMVYNLADLKREMNEVLELVDHKHLDMDVPYFRDNGIVSTTENLAVFLYNELSAKMASPGLLHKVIVCETDKNCFSFSGYSS